MSLHPELRAYADTLKAHGFTIYVPKSIKGLPDAGTFFIYSRVVDGRECFGNVQVERFGGFAHHMPIKPSRENGSSMWVGEEQSEKELTVEKAQEIASPTNYNHLVGRQENYEDAGWLARGYDREDES